MQQLKNNALIHVLRREFLRMQKHIVYLFMTMVGPLIAIWLLMGIFSEGVVRKLPIAIVDLDHSALATKISRIADASPAASVVMKASSVAQAKQKMEEGKIQAILVIPKGTEKNLFKGTENKLALYVNNTNSLQGGVLSSGIKKAIRTLSTGIKIQSLQKQGLSKEAAMGQAMPIRLDTHILFNPFGSYSYFLTAGILPVLLIVFVLLMSIYAIGIELKESTCQEWMHAANNSIIIALTGKLLPYTILFMIDAMVINVVLFAHLGTPLNGSIWLIILSEFFLIVTYQMIAIFFMAITANLRLSLSFGTAYSMMALTFSGLTFPRLAMPTGAEVYSLVFPYSYWLKVFLSQSLRGEPIMNAIPPMLVFLIFIVLGFLCFPRMKKLVSNEKFWGKI